MQTLGRFCAVFVTYTVLELYQRFLRIFLGFLVMDCVSTLIFLTQASEIGCGIFLLGCVSRVFNLLGMILIFVFCMKILHFGWHSKALICILYEYGEKPRKYFCLKNSAGEVCDSKIAPFKDDSLKSSQNSSLPNKTKKHMSVGKGNVNSSGDFNSKDVLEEKDDNEGKGYDEDEVFDVITLRNLVRIERQRANSAYAELEKERMASASAAEEAMAMILRLQSEKSSVEIQANQYQRMAKQKQEFDQEMIEYLRWIIMQHESQVSLLEDKLELYREKLRQYMREDEIDQMEEGLDANRGLLNFSVEEDDDFDGSLVSSLGMNSSQVLTVAS